MKSAKLIILGCLAGIIIGLLITKYSLFKTPNVKVVHAQLAQIPTDTPSPSITSLSLGGASSNQNNPTSTPKRTNPFNYTPLPNNRGGPENDIVESGPLTASRTSVQVDDSIGFSVTVKNVAPYDKIIKEFCYESTDGNFGCAFNVRLSSGQEYTYNNVGTWTTGGSKRVWVEWSQDLVNFYEPINANSVLVNIQG